jgi:hypothetical protein
LAPEFCFHFGDLGDDSQQIIPLTKLKSTLKRYRESNFTSAVIPIIGLSGVGKTTVCYGVCVDEYAIYFQCSKLEAWGGMIMGGKCCA